MLYSSLLTWAFIFMLFYLFSFEHLSLCFFMLHTWVFFPFWRYLITNLKIKSLKITWTIWLLSLTLWSCGPLGLRMRSPDTLGTLWFYCYFVWSSWGLPQDIGLLVCFCVQVFVIASLICNLEFTRIQPLLCPIFGKS